MRPDKTVAFQFVETVPTLLNDDTVYVSIPYTTAVHKCFCGCGNEVVTPLSPTDWALNFDGKSISLDPSVGNWNLPCQSHYWIKKNTVKWAPLWSADRIRAGRATDALAKADYYGRDEADNLAANTETASEASPPVGTMSFWSKLLHWFRG